MRTVLPCDLIGRSNHQAIIVQLDNAEGGPGTPKNTQEGPNRDRVGVGCGVVREGFLERMPALSLKECVGIKHM